MDYMKNTDTFKLYVEVINWMAEPVPSFKKRFQSLHAQIFFLFFLIILTFYLFRKFVVGKFEEKINRMLTCRRCRSNKSKDDDLKYTDEFVLMSHDFYKELSIPHLSALYRKSIKDLDEYQTKYHDYEY